MNDNSRQRRIRYVATTRSGYTHTKYGYDLFYRRLVIRRTRIQADASWPGGYALRTRTHVCQNVLAADFFAWMGKKNRKGELVTIEGIRLAPFHLWKSRF